MITVIIISIIAITVIYLLIAPANERQELNPPKIDLDYEPEQIPIYGEFRRVQQALSRKSRVVEDQIKEIGLGQQKIAIGNLLLELGNKHLEVKSDIIAADEKALDTTKREIEALMRWNKAEIKEKSAQLLLSKVDLQAMLNEIAKNYGLLELKEGEIKLQEMGIGLRELQAGIYHKANLVDLQEYGLGLEAKKMGLEKTQNEIAHQLNQIALGDKNQDLRNKELDLKEQLNSIKNLQALLALGKIDLSLDKKGLDLQEKSMGVKNQLGLLNLGKKDLELTKKELGIEESMNEIKLRLGLMKVMEKDLDSKKRGIGLDKREVLLERFHNKNLQELGEIAMGKKEVQLGRKELEHVYKVKSFQLETTIQKIRHMYTDLQLERKAWKNERKEDKLNLYRQELNNLDRYVHQMYEVKMNWLRIQERENRISYKEDRLALQDLYNNTMTKLDSLRLQRWENGLVLREGEVARKQSALGFIGKSWLH